MLFSQIDGEHVTPGMLIYVSLQIQCLHGVSEEAIWGTRTFTGKLSDYQFDFEYIQTKYLNDISKYTAARRHNCCSWNKVCFKYRPRCNKFLFLPFIRPITVQGSKGRWEGENRCKVSKEATTVCIPFPALCSPTGYKCVGSSVSWKQKQLSAQATV